MIDIEKETVFPLSLARKVVSVGGKELHVSTLWRWCRRGLRGVKLEHVRVGHRVCTSTQAISRFVNKLAEVETHLPSHVSEHTANHTALPGSEASIKRAEAVLARAGI